jgi:hypothetical protein
MERDCYLGGELLPWSLATGGLASGLLSTSHWIGEGRRERKRRRRLIRFSKVLFIATKKL